MQTSALALLIGMTVLLQGCSIFGDGRDTSRSEADAATTVVASVRPPAYLGANSLEERIFKSPVVARVRLDSVSSTVESGLIYEDTKHIALLEFNFSVIEYLKGSGADDMAAVWAAAPLFDTRQEAEAALPAIAAARDDRWDNHDAIIFLRQSAETLSSTQQADRYYLAWGGTWKDYGYYDGRLDDGYSLASRHNKFWLPAEAASGAQSQPSGDQQRFLMDVPPETGSGPTITLGEFKTRIAAVTAKLDAGDGSDDYIKCVQDSYRLERKKRYRAEMRPERPYTGSNISPPNAHVFNSGLAGGTAVYELLEDSDIVPGVPFQVWLDDGASDLFDAATPSRNYRVTATRPLHGGQYKFYLNHRGPFYSLCDGWTIRYDWTITVTAPEGTLHEAFFDPVTDGTTVAADDTNGVLKPATFTDTDGTSATIERIAWEPGTVKLELDPHTGIAGHILDFFALDGSVPLSLNVADATADAANDTLSWAVASQPWEDGDELMLRVREVPDCSNGTVVPNPADNPGLKRDCVTLLGLKDTLRGTATLNWSEDTAITSWDGVRVKGSPGRVTEVLLTSKGLTGTIPPDLGRLDGLQHLWFNINQLAGAIPSELGSLASLQTLILNDNRLTGAVPRELGGLSSLETLWLDRNRLSGEIPAALGDLSSLRRLTLSVNRLSGSIPSDLGNLTNLEYLWLNVNRLTGTIPSELGSLDDLRNLRLGSNQLTGCIPPALRDVDDHDLNDLGLQNCPTP